MDWRRLGEAVYVRRVELGMHRQQDLAKATGLTRRVLGDIENGRRGNYDQVTLSRVEKGLAWMPGSVQAVLAGGPPRPVEDARLSNMSLVDPRALERGVDDIGIMALVVQSGLAPEDALRLIEMIRARRAEQYADLLAEVRRWIADAGGHVEDDSPGGLR